MTAPAPTHPMTPDAFLGWERTDPERHAYFHGGVFAMSGVSPRHSRLAARCTARLDGALAGRPHADRRGRAPKVHVGADPRHREPQSG
ncbi:MAG: hypothetical protein IT373_31190 [Polyangiaceae bacterium]|nr:hypothetical protein [Polyangiaceae bacterium]